MFFSLKAEASKQPDWEAEIDKAFVLSYPGLTLHPDDRYCVAGLAAKREKSCTVTRKIAGGFADVKYTNYRGNLVVTSPGGAVVARDSDIQAFDAAG